MLSKAIRCLFRFTMRKLPFSKKLRTGPSIFAFLTAGALYCVMWGKDPRITADRICVFLGNYWAGDMVDFAYADSIKGYYHPVVPNVVHFLHLANRSLTLQEAICIRAAWLIQRPRALVLHCQNCSAMSLSFYWNHVKKIPGLDVRSVALPKSTYGTKTADIRSFLAVQILHNEGGIYVDKDVYLVRNVDAYRHFEMALAWPETGSPRTELIVAHRNARFLQLWWNASRHPRPPHLDVDPEELRRQLSTEFSAAKIPLFHRMPITPADAPAAVAPSEAPIAIASRETAQMLYSAECDDSWRRLTAVSLMTGSAVQLMKSRGEPPVNLVAIGSSRTNFGQMARLALTGSTGLGVLTVSKISEIRVLEYAPSPCIF